MEGRALVAWNLRRLRVAKGLSQVRLAADAGVDKTFVGQIEREERSVSVDILERLAKALGCMVREFFDPPADGDERSDALRSGRKPRR